MWILLILNAVEEQNFIKWLARTTRRLKNLFLVGRNKPQSVVSVINFMSIYVIDWLMGSAYLIWKDSSNKYRNAPLKVIECRVLFIRHRMQLTSRTSRILPNYIVIPVTYVEDLQTDYRVEHTYGKCLSCGKFHLRN